MNEPNLKKIIKHLRITTEWKAHQYLEGVYASSFKGQGLDFAEVRPFQMGDEIRHIDWNVTARTGFPHIKLFQEEHCQNVFFFVDISFSTRFNSGRKIKERIAEICALLSFAALNDHNRIALLLFSDRVETYLPPCKKNYPVSRIINKILTVQPVSGKTNIQAVCDYYQGINTRHNIIFILSDFFSPSFDKGLSLLSRSNSVVGIMIYDDWEIKPLLPGYFPLKDPENGQKYWVDLGNKKVRQSHADNIQLRKKIMRHTFLKNRGDFISMTAREDCIMPLIKLFQQRKKKLSR